jgi:hypothetical protein
MKLSELDTKKKCDDLENGKIVKDWWKNIQFVHMVVQLLQLEVFE